jgi:hypothetical protein
MRLFRKKWPRPWATGGAGIGKPDFPLRLGGMDNDTVARTHPTGDARGAIDSHRAFWATIYLGCPSAEKDTKALQDPRRRQDALWRASILRSRLGDVQAPDERQAEAAAVTEFRLDDEQRKRLVVQERGIKRPWSGRYSESAVSGSSQSPLILSPFPLICLFRNRGSRASSGSQSCTVHNHRYAPEGRAFDSSCQYQPDNSHSPPTASAPTHRARL